MTSQITLQSRRIQRPGAFRQTLDHLKQFFINRSKDAGYGMFFATIFLLGQSPAHSLAIDDIRVLSRLGEPLIAEVAVTPAAGEVLERGCFRATRAAGDLPSVGPVRLQLSRRLNQQVLSISGVRPMREPMSEFILQVKCPGAPTMIKTFLVMVDPPAAGDPVFPAEIAQTDNTTVFAAPGTTTSRTPRRAPRGTSTPRPIVGDIQPGSRYQVQTGDMLSTIAARVSGRPDWSVWPIANHIYKTNPGAFLLGDPNAIAQGAVVVIPRLENVDMSADSRIRPAARAAAARSVNSTTTRPVESSTAIGTPANRATATTQPATATTVTRTLAPIVATAAAVPAAPLATMQLTTTLLKESQLKMQLRLSEKPVVPVAAKPAPVAQTTSPVEITPTVPDPQSQPDRPDNIVTSTRAALQTDTSVASSSLNWTWIVIGLLGGLLAGAFVAVGLFRRNLRQEYEHDVRSAVQRQARTDRLRQQRDLDEEAAARSQTQEPPQASTPVPTVELPAAEVPAATVARKDDYTVEINAMPEVDFDITGAEPARTGEPETLEIPEAADLDLKLPASDSPASNQTGQHEVDFDLLEQAYSEHYQTEFVDKEKGEDLSKAGEAKDEKFYHLENQDDSDDTPLPFELGDDDLGDDDMDDDKVVRFRSK